MTADALRSPVGVSRLVRARWGWIVATAAVVTLSAAVFSLTQTPRYEATAAVVVLAEVKPGDPPPPAPSMGTEKELASSEIITSVAARSIGVPLIDLEDSVAVSVPVDTQVMQIRCTRTDPVMAQRCAQELAQAYVAYKDSQPISTVPQRARVITPAQLPPAPSQPQTVLNLAAGLLVGLVIGFLVALLRDRLDDRVRGATELDARGLPVLAVVPPVGPPTDPRDFEPTALPAAGEAYGALAEKVLLTAGLAVQPRPVPHPRPARPAPVVAVTSVDTHAGAGRTVAMELATALAGGGQRVAVVDADTRAMSHREDGSAATPGLLDVLAHRLPLASALRDTGIPQLSLLPVGRRVTGAAARIVVRRWLEVSAALSGSCDVIVVAAAPAHAAADGLRVVQHATAVLVTVEERRTDRSAVDRLLAELEQVNAPVIGSVLIGRQRGRRADRAEPRRTEQRSPTADASAQRDNHRPDRALPAPGAGPKNTPDPAELDRDEPAITDHVPHLDVDVDRAVLLTQERTRMTR